MMDHPSMGPEEDDEPEGLPNGVTREQIEDLIREVIDKAQMVGLYADPHVGVHVEEDTMFLAVRFDIGQVAWTKRVQDPVADESETAFRQIENPLVRDHNESIKNRFLDE